MHVPDGFLDVPTSLATGGIALGAVGLSLGRAREEIARTGPALPGLVAAFVFATQMVNFPVGAGTSGHLLGGALAAALVGPWTAVLVLTVVLLVQALLFADGGITALGTNVVLIAVVTVLVGYAVTRGAARLLPRRPGTVVPAAALGAFVSVPVAALAFVGLYAAGGAVPIPLPTLSAAMLGWHLLVGVGEAVITAAVLGAVVAARPDLVHAASAADRPTLIVDTPTGTRHVAPDRHEPVAVRPGRSPLVAGGLMTLVVAGLLSLAASAHPDGLEYVAGRLGFEGAAGESLTAASPLADYGLAGLDAAWAGGLAGVIGVAATAFVAALVLRAVGGRRERRVSSSG